MISLECQQRSGTVIGACADGPLFGACCHAPSEPPQPGAHQKTSLEPQKADEIVAAQLTSSKDVENLTKTTLETTLPKKDNDVDESVSKEMIQNDVAATKSITTEVPTTTIMPKAPEKAINTVAKVNSPIFRVIEKPVVKPVEVTTTTAKFVEEARAQSVKLSNKDEKIMEELIVGSNEQLVTSRTVEKSEDQNINLAEQLFPVIRRKLEKAKEVKKEENLGQIGADFLMVADSFSSKKKKEEDTKFEESTPVSKVKEVAKKTTDEDSEDQDSDETDSQENWEENLNDFVSQVELI